jgi:hypothetical protein
MPAACAADAAPARHALARIRRTKGIDGFALIITAYLFTGFPTDEAARYGNDSGSPRQRKDCQRQYSQRLTVQVQEYADPKKTTRYPLFFSDLRHFS